MLDKENNQIVRLTQSANGFVNAQKWLKANIDLSAANSLAADGYVYILFNLFSEFKHYIFGSSYNRLRIN